MEARRETSVTVNYIRYAKKSLSLIAMVVETLIYQ